MSTIWAKESPQSNLLKYFLLWIIFLQKTHDHTLPSNHWHYLGEDKASADSFAHFLHLKLYINFKFYGGSVCFDNFHMNYS